MAIRAETKAPANKEQFMPQNYQLITNLPGQIKEIPENTILSQTVEDTPAHKSILFGFDTGQELSEHTSSFPALIYVTSGAFDIRLGDDPHSVEAGAWVSMEPNLPHSLTATEPSTMLLILIKTK
jgi:quercetin dioxygenase-like cupin family protein